MEKNIKKLNKQIAIFMLVSLALSAVAIADTKENLKITTFSSEESGYENQTIKDAEMYSAPEIIENEHKPASHEYVMMKYDTPQAPEKRINIPLKQKIEELEKKQNKNNSTNK